MLTILEEKMGHEEGLGHWFSGSDSAGGVSVSLSFRNDFNKTIAYIYFAVVPYNSVGDIVKSEIAGQSGMLQYTGPLEPGKTAYDRRWDNCFYGFDIVGIKVVYADVKFTDGTEQIVKSLNRGGNHSYKNTGNESKTILGQTIAKKKLVLACIVLGAVIFTLVSLKFNIFVSLEYKWLITLVRVFYYLQLIIPLGFIVIEIIGLLQFKENIQKKLEFAIILTCFSLNVLHTVFGVLATCLGGSMNYAFISVILNLPLTVTYFAYNHRVK